MIERDHGQCKALNDEYIGTVIKGDASRPGILRQADPENLDVEFAPNAPAAGRRLDSVRLPRGSLIIAHAGGDRVSGAETVLEPGERYLVAVEAAVNEEVMNLFRG